MFELSNRYSLHMINDFHIQYVSLISRHQDKWVICHLKEKDKWDCPGGKIEKNERPIEAAKRELHEETGTTKAEFYPLYIYEITSDKGLSYGIQYYCKILEIGPMPNSEMDRVEFVDELPFEKMDTPQVHSKLIEDIQKVIREGLVE